MKVLVIKELHWGLNLVSATRDAKDFYKKIRGIGVEKWVNRVKIMGGTIVLECF